MTAQPVAASLAGVVKGAHVHVYSVVLFIHLLSLLIAAGAAAVLALAQVQMRRAERVRQVAQWALAAKNTARVFPFAVAGLVGSGIYLVQSSWSFSDPWVLGGICGLAAIVVLGDAVDGRHGRKIGRAAGEALLAHGDGHLGPDLKRLLSQPLPKAVSLAPTLLMLGVVFVMVTKPGAAGSAAALLVALALSVPCGPALFRTSPTTQGE
jgi:hypothetical protein